MAADHLSDHQKKALQECKQMVQDALNKHEFSADPPQKDDDKKTEKPEETESQAAKESEGVVVPTPPEEVSIWGIPLLADERSDVILLKFLRARDFKVKDAFTMMKSTIRWRKEFGNDKLMDENLSDGLEKELCKEASPYEGTRLNFQRRRFQFLEKCFRKVDSFPSGLSNTQQIYERLKISTEQTIKQAFHLLQYKSCPQFEAAKSEVPSQLGCCFDYCQPIGKSSTESQAQGMEKARMPRNSWGSLYFDFSDESSQAQGSKKEGMRKGIRTFFDDVDLQRGKEITPTLLSAIEQSRMSIIAVSKNYASSTFCLDELENIMRRRIKIYPVFYNVDPSVVQHRRGSYGEAFAKHKHRFQDNNEILRKRRDPLCAAANLSGSLFFQNRSQSEYKSKSGMIEETLTKIQPRGTEKASIMPNLLPRAETWNRIISSSKTSHYSNYSSTTMNKRANMQKVSTWLTVMTFPGCLYLSNYRHSLCSEQISLSIWGASLGMLNFTAFLSSLLLMAICGAHFTPLHVTTLLISAMLSMIAFYLFTHV